MMQKSKIAVTGGIGSGKSLALSLLFQMGYPVLSCDEISHRLWLQDAYRSELAAAFPSCLTNGSIDKSKLSAHIFADAEARAWLEKLSHPRIMGELLREMEGLPVCFAEVPLLFEGGYEKLFDAVLLITRPQADRIAAIVKRDNTSREEAFSRISAQLTDAEKMREGVVVIENSGSVDELREKLRLALKSLGL